ncbi:transcription factor/nuclear export subunit protein 2-domain-containing protein [Chytriomyces cf. hyalinus JEL632]|nr:transcription factor/nuclear export subunit protein 2-domain-containing protein [Chytriomyces cf. hyalinus JEL632]
MDIVQPLFAAAANANAAQRMVIDRAGRCVSEHEWVSLVVGLSRAAMHASVATPVQVAEMLVAIQMDKNCNTDSVSLPSLATDALWLMDTEMCDEDQSLRPRLLAFAKRLHSLAFIPVVMLCERLDFDFLEAMGVIQSAQAMNRKYIRTNTAIVYKQQKFNLLREESEGFAMLETHLASVLPPSYQVFWQKYHSKSETRESMAERYQSHLVEKATSVLEHITSLIGYFDLNPNKVLDLILDVFIANVVDNWDFFVVLLSHSHWQPKPSDSLNGPGVMEPSAVLGHILGFKFDYYNHVANTHVTTPQLIWVTAILVKHKLVKLEHVYPHLAPLTDVEMDAEWTAFKEKINLAKKGAGKYKDTSLAEAGALGDGGGSEAYQVKERGSNNEPVPAASSIASAATDPALTAPIPKPRKTNQKAVLASYLFAIGAITPARQIIDKHPLLIQMHPDIGEYMSRILHVVIEPVYKTLRPIRSRVKPEIPAHQPPPMNTLNYKYAQEEAHIGKRGVVHYPKLQFFYEAWKEGLPACKDYDEVVKLLRVLLPYICVTTDVILVSKIARIGKAHVNSAPSEDKVKNNWMSITSKFLFPALSMTDQNPALSNDIWGLVKLFPHDRRYALYGEWKHKTYTTNPLLGVAKAGCISDVKYTMRRLSKETVKRFGRYVGKIAHGNPTIAFHHILNLLQTYENQNATVVEGSKYMSELSFDIVAYTLIEQLSSGGSDGAGSTAKERMQPGGIGVRTWLKSLSFFAGAIFKKHSIEMGGLLRYLYAQVVHGNTLDLVILQEIVAQMSGIKAICDDVTTDQFGALGAGETLKRECFGNEPVRVLKKFSARLLKSIVETDLVVGFAVLMGQHCAGSVFDEGVGEIKVLGWLLDNIRATFTQYLDFVVTNMDKDAFAAAVPAIDVLRVSYGLMPDVAFTILRPKLNTILKTKPEISGESMEVDGEIAQPQYHPGLEGTIQSVRKTLPSQVWDTMSPHFYITFWQLSLSDIAFPKDKYLAEIAKLKATVEALAREKGNVPPNNTPAKRKKDRERHLATILLLEKEMEVQSAESAKTLARLKHECLTWFQPNESVQDLKAFGFQLVDLIIQHCLVPRCLFSPADAIYTAKFIYLAHSLGAPNLMTVPVFDKILDRNNLQSMIYICSEMEARNYGRFLCEILTTLTQWFTKLHQYTQECIGDGLPGFALRWNPDADTSTPITKLPISDLMKHEEFSKVMFKWHSKMHRAFTLCLESGEYAQITNAVIVLDKISDVFPLIREHAIQLDESCRGVAEKEVDRKDLKLMCTAYSGRLQVMARKLMTKAAFQNGGVDPNPQASQPLVTNSRSSSGMEAPGRDLRMSRGMSSDQLDMRSDRDRGSRGDRDAAGRDTRGGSGSGSGGTRIEFQERRSDRDRDARAPPARIQERSDHRDDRRGANAAVVEAKIVEKDSRSSVLPVKDSPRRSGRDDAFRSGEETKRVEAVRISEKKDDTRRVDEEAKRGESARPSEKKEDGRRVDEEPKRDEVKKEDLKKEEPRREEAKRDDTKRDEVKRDDTKRDDPKRTDRRDKDRRGDRDERRQDGRDDKRTDRDRDRDRDDSRRKERGRDRVRTEESSSIATSNSPPKVVSSSVNAPIDAPAAVVEKKATDDIHLRQLREKLKQSKNAAHSTDGEPNPIPGLPPRPSISLIERRPEGPDKAPSPPPPPPIAHNANVPRADMQPSDTQQKTAPNAGSPAERPRLSIIERLGKRSESSTSTPASTPENDRSIRKERDEGASPKDRGSGDVDRSRDRSDKGRDGRDRGDRRERKNRDKDDSEQRKRDRDQSNLEREPKRPKMDEIEGLPSRPDRKRQSDDAAPASVGHATGDQKLDPKAASTGGAQSANSTAIVTDAGTADTTPATADNATKRFKIDRSSLENNAGSQESVAPPSIAERLGDPSRQDVREGGGEMGRGRNGDGRGGRGRDDQSNSSGGYGGRNGGGGGHRRHDNRNRDGGGNNRDGNGNRDGRNDRNDRKYR